MNVKENIKRIQEVRILNGFKTTLIKKVNADPNDASIKLEFLKWNKSGGKVLNGLTLRRNAESELYFS